MFPCCLLFQELMTPKTLTAATIYTTPEKCTKKPCVCGGLTHVPTTCPWAYGCASHEPCGWHLNWNTTASAFSLARISAWYDIHVHYNTFVDRQTYLLPSVSSIHKMIFQLAGITGVVIRREMTFRDSLCWYIWMCTMKVTQTHVLILALFWREYSKTRNNILYRTWPDQSARRLLHFSTKTR